MGSCYFLLALARCQVSGPQLTPWCFLFHQAVRCEFVVNHFQVRIKKVQLGVAATHLDVHHFFCTAGRADLVAQQVFSEWSHCTRTQILLSRPDSLTC